MGHCQQHQVLGLKLAESTAEAVPLAEGGATVGPAGVGHQQRWHRMPWVALEQAWG